MTQALRAGETSLDTFHNLRRSWQSIRISSTPRHARQPLPRAISAREALADMPVPTESTNAGALPTGCLPLCSTYVLSLLPEHTLRILLKFKMQDCFRRAQEVLSNKFPQTDPQTMCIFASLTFQSCSSCTHNAHMLEVLH